MALISRVAYTNENAKTDDEFMAIALVNQEHCPQLNGTSTCNSISNVFEADVPDFPVNNISETVNNISQTTTTMKRKLFFLCFLFFNISFCL